MKVKIELEVGGKKISLTPEEMRELYEVLGGVIQDKRVELVPYYPYWYPYYPTFYSPFITGNWDSANATITNSDGEPTSDYYYCLEEYIHDCTLLSRIPV